TPVKTTNASRGMSTSTLRRLSSRAPRTWTKPSRRSGVSSRSVMAIINSRQRPFPFDRICPVVAGTAHEHEPVHRPGEWTDILGRRRNAVVADDRDMRDECPARLRWDARLHQTTPQYLPQPTQSGWHVAAPEPPGSTEGAGTVQRQVERRELLRRRSRCLTRPVQQVRRQRREVTEELEREVVASGPQPPPAYCMSRLQAVDFVGDALAQVAAGPEREEQSLGFGRRPEQVRWLEI